MKFVTTLSISGLLLVGGAMSALAQQGDAPPAPVKVGKASRQSIATMMTANGTIVPIQPMMLKIFCMDMVSLATFRCPPTWR